MLHGLRLLVHNGHFTRRTLAVIYFSALSRLPVGKLWATLSVSKIQCCFVSGVPPFKHFLAPASNKDPAHLLEICQIGRNCAKSALLKLFPNKRNLSFLVTLRFAFHNESSSCSIFSPLYLPMFSLSKPFHVIVGGCYLRSLGHSIGDLF